MYLHVGNNKNIRIRDIIGIFDADTATISSVTRKYLTAAEREHLVLSAKDEIPKSFILYRENGKFMVCFSQISTSALLGRAEGERKNDKRN